MGIPAGYAFAALSVLWNQTDNSGPYGQDAAGNVYLIGNLATTGASAHQVQGNVASGVADVGNPVKIGGKYNATLPTFADGQRGDLQTGTRGSLSVQLMQPDTTSSIATANGASDAVSTGFVALTARAIGYIFNGASFDRSTKANATNRLLSSAATTNATNVKASAGNLFKIICNNTNAADKFLKLYNKATAPTVGTDTPIFTLTLPLTSKNISFDFGGNGHYFSLGIGFALTGVNTDADTTAVAAGDITGLNISYG